MACSMLHACYRIRKQCKEPLMSSFLFQHVAILGKTHTTIVACSSDLQSLTSCTSNKAEAYGGTIQAIEIGETDTRKLRVWFFVLIHIVLIYVREVGGVCVCVCVNSVYDTERHGLSLSCY